MRPNRRSIVDWGVRYVGYPYIWGGEWGFVPQPPALGGQPGPGFDCSGLGGRFVATMAGSERSHPHGPTRGVLPQRTSAQMARWTNHRVRVRGTEARRPDVLRR